MRLDNLCALKEHEKDCEFKLRKSSGTSKKPWSSFNRQYLKRKRLKKVIESVNAFCEENNEDVDDVLFSMLYIHMHDKNYKSKAAQVEALWKDSWGDLSVDDCLALRVGNIETKSNYKKECDLLKQHGIQALSPPTALDAKEKEYVPPSSR